ncbi:MAG: IS1634 family transposase, partial [Anaerococcus sp.]|nr:IS1634 family transposase [Anaerococcus sp.]
KLKIDKICDDISLRHKFSFDLNECLSYMVFDRILNPSSKLSTFESTKNYLIKPKFEIQHLYRALSVLSEEIDFIQSSIYENSKRVIDRNTKVLFYDCTNFFFEIEQDDDFRKYGFSKEHRPNPIVQMGMFLDGSGIPLSFSVFSGNINEQLSLKPLEKRIISDFSCSDFVVCTDAGLSSMANRMFNSTSKRDFITTQSVKKLKGYLKDWALDPNGWFCSYDLSCSRKFKKRLYNLEKDVLTSTDHDFKYSTFYKERWIKDDNGFEQRLIISFSLGYKEYLDSLNLKQLERADKKIKSNRVNSKKANDVNRFINSMYFTKEGERATKSEFSLDFDKFIEENKYNGFYGICTSLDENDGFTTRSIINISSRRWMIERMFRVLKSELSARPVYLSRPDRIKAHFLTCFIALQIITILDKKLKSKYPIEKVLECLRNYNFLSIKNKGYLPSYKRDDITDLLHDTFNFRTDYEINDMKRMKKIIKDRKKRKFS